ncbi:MAG: AAA-like domain-containing protein, partial [Pelolinea sp.]|nr:AAA-like domain-containing protein [Pelolinea sp.]
QDAAILPIRVEKLEPDGAMGLHLSSRQWLDAYDPSLEDHINELIKAVSSKLESVINEENILAPEKTKQGQKKQNMSNNPFTFGNPIREPERFIGRKEDIRQVTNRLLSSARESTSIVGERRIGKTSLLKYLTNPEIAESFGLKKEEFCLVYIDFQGLNDITPQRFWQRVLRLMARSMENNARKQTFKDLSNAEYIDLFDLEDLFESIGSDGTHVVLLLDEFEYVTQNPNFDSDFFGGLRSLAIHYNLSLVPATRRELVELCHSEEIKGSPFFNIFATVVLKPFSSEETDSLIQNYTRTAGIDLSPKEADFIRQVGGGYPFFVQMIGHYLTAGKEAGKKGNALLDYATLEFNQQAEPHFNYLWTHSSESEKTTLVTVMALESQNREAGDKKQGITADQISAIYPRSPRDIINLIKRGSLIERDEDISLFSTSYAGWIGVELTAAPGEEESDASVDAWIHSSEDGELLQTKDVLTKTKKKYWPVVGKVLKEFSVELIGNIAVEMMRGF